MKRQPFNTNIIRTSLFVLTFNWLVPAHSAPGTLADSPLFTANNVPPNVFVELDDSGSMDWEILTKKYWHVCAYNNSDTCGWLVDNGLFRMHTGSSWQYFEYLYDNNDDAYGNSCNNDRQTLDLCTTAVQEADWRIRNSAVNVMYYDPAVKYIPWNNGTATAMPDASFTAARSNPQPGTAGYSETKDLSGFIYHVWDDTHGYSGARPTGGTINKTTGANGEVDWWDEHDKFTVNASSITVERITYSGKTETVSSTTTLTGTGTHSELGGMTIAEVQKNIANWYQYGRRRAFAAKAAIGRIVTENPDYRWGISVINEYSTLFTEIPIGLTGFGTHNATLLDNLFDFTWQAHGTPLRRGLERAGKYYDNNLSGKADPILDSCQQNFTILATDGYWNGSNPASAIGNADGDGHSISVADVAKYYYDKDLSPLANDVVVNISDPATWQHMVTYTVAFGVTGLLTDTDADGWPGNAPGLSASDDWGDPMPSANEPEKIDDLWHAAYNSKGTFVSAATPGKVSDALTAALGNIADRVGSASSVAFNTTTLTGSSAVYLAQFNSSNNKWSGDLLSFPLDALTGDVASTPSWKAADILDAKSNPVANRTILTYDKTTGTGKKFRWDQLTTDQQDDLRTNPDGTLATGTAGDDLAKARLDFIRGERSNEQSNNGTYTFRNRSKLLGDIVHSDPIFIGKPALNWPAVAPFPTGTDSYRDFTNGTAKTRTELVYVGTNDGMLHGFSAADGDEKIAYIPSNMFVKNVADQGLHYLTDPTYTHRYYVDLPTAVSDVYIDTTGSGTGDAWHTILTGGNRAGGKGIFALDITDPSQFSESNAANLVLWEFDSSDDADMGFSYSKPAIVMLNNDRWAAIFGNGYNNNGDGTAKLFILFLDGGLDGTWTLNTDYIEIPTKSGANVIGDCSDCNGLSTPQAVDMDGDKVVDRIYAGDLFGNLWAFDLSASNPNQWDVAYKQGSTPKPLFTASYSGTAQPITSKPILIKHPDHSGAAPDVLVFFGTGQYLTSSDILNTDVQSFYGVWDHGTHSLTPSDLQEQTFISGSFFNNSVDITNDIRVLTKNPVDYTSKHGWKINLTLAAGERVVVDPDVRGDVVFFNTWIPDNVVCNSGGKGFLMSVSQLGGGRTDDPVFDVNGVDGVDSADLVEDSSNVIFAASGQRFTLGLPASSNFLSNKQYTPGTDGGSEIGTRDLEDLGGIETGRLSWQELR